MSVATKTKNPTPVKGRTYNMITVPYVSKGELGDGKGVFTGEWRPPSLSYGQPRLRLPYFKVNNRVFYASEWEAITPMGGPKVAKGDKIKVLGMYSTTEADGTIQTVTGWSEQGHSPSLPSDGFPMVNLEPSSSSTHVTAWELYERAPVNGSLTGTKFGYRSNEELYEIMDLVDGRYRIKLIETDKVLSLTWLPASITNNFATGLWVASTGKPERKFHRFMNEMTITTDGRPYPSTTPDGTKYETVCGRDAKGRYFSVPSEWLQPEVKPERPEPAVGSKVQFRGVWYRSNSSTYKSWVCIEHPDNPTVVGTRRSWSEFKTTARDYNNWKLVN